MPEEAPEQIQDTPAPDAPVEGSADTPQFDDSQYVPITRYSEAQAWGTKASQEAASLREQNEAYQTLLTTDDQAARLAAAEVLGIELEQPDTQEYLDPTDELRQEIADLRSWRDQVTQAEQQEQQAIQEAEFIDQQLGALEQNIGHELSEKQVEAIAGLAILNRNEQGQPNVQAAYELFAESSKAEVNRILEGKKQAPQVPGGQPGTQAPDLSSMAAKLAYAEERLSALNSNE